ncbi:hypothetical protein M0Q97_06905 [Candidatus Dojkabacteria bacterium]|jgi:hypothetical protein|nr:hypothetical protein [Candidatus Dojkabacteria bacterium]
MRKKIPEQEKKVSVNLTINSQLNDILIEHIKEKNINKSKFIGKILEDNLKNNK